MDQFLCASIFPHQLLRFTLLFEVQLRCLGEVSFVVVVDVAALPFCGFMQSMSSILDHEITSFFILVPFHSGKRENVREEVKFNHHRLTRCVCELTRDKKIVGENDNDNENRGEMGRQKIYFNFSKIM